MIWNARRIWGVCLLGAALSLGVGVGVARAQSEDHALSNLEVDKLRDSSYVPCDRLGVFIKILDSRSKSIDGLLAKKRKPGREQDLHDLYDQFSAIADELTDNLDEYGPKHRDIRRALPKLIEATERWATALRAAADDPAYNVVRKLALDSVRDVHDVAAKMQTEQLAYFTAHPEAVKAEQDRISNTPTKQEPIDLPR